MTSYMIWKYQGSRCVCVRACARMWEQPVRVHVRLHLCVSVHVCVRAQWRVFERDSTRQSYYCRIFKKQAPILPSVVACWLARAATDRRRQGGHGSGRLLLPNPGPTTGRRARRDRLGGAAREEAHASAVQRELSNALARSMCCGAQRPH